MLAIAVALAAVLLLLGMVQAIDATLSLWQRLESLPVVLRIGLVALLAAFGLGTLWLLWRLLRPRAAREPRAAEIDRSAVEARIAALAALPGADAAVAAAREELTDLDRRRDEGRVQLALFGEVSAGKSSVLKALVPTAEAGIDVVGGSTRAVQRHEGRLADGSTIVLADLPGTREAGDAARAALAAAEAARAHALIYVCDGDLTRAQDAELRALAIHGRPVLVLLNKSDRFDATQRETLLAALRARYLAPQYQVLAVSAGHGEEVWKEWPDGRRERVLRARAAQLGALPGLLQALARLGAQALEPGREAALLARIEGELATAERSARAAEAERIVSRYTRRAVLGALAAVAPGTDLVIQGALATAMLRELGGLHGLGVRDLDVDDFLSRAGGVVRSTTSIVLAVAGNALKAFPGLGTLGGGLLHAVAYGLIFDSLGRAAAESLTATAALDRDATLSAFQRRLQAPAAERLQALAGLALDAWRERSHGTATPQQASSSPPPARDAG